MSMWKFYLEPIVNNLLILVLAVLCSLIVDTIANNRVHAFILGVIGGVFIGLINFYKEPINDYLRTVINKTKKK